MCKIFFAKPYQLEIDIRVFKQNNMSIHEFYSLMTNLWDHMALNEFAELHALQLYTKFRKQ